MIKKAKFHLLFICSITIVCLAVIYAKNSEVAIGVRQIIDEPRTFVHKNKDLTNVPVFHDKTFTMGVLHKHDQKKKEVASFADATGAGVCSADFNNDGWDDLFFVGGSGSVRHFGKKHWWSGQSNGHQLYLNVNGKFFKNISNIAGFKELSFGIGCAVSDFDNDGFIDLIVANKGKNQVYRNLGDNTFELVGDSIKNDPGLFSTGILITDFNSDGLDDILVGNYVKYKQDQKVLEIDSGYKSQENYNFNPLLYEAQPDNIYINQGEFLFTKFTSVNLSGRTLGYFSYGDILALNDIGSPSRRLFSQPSFDLPTLSVSARDAKLLSVNANQDKLLVLSNAEQGGISALSTKNRFKDFSWDLGLNISSSISNHSWAILSEDFNSDGVKDIFIANGMPSTHPAAKKTSFPQKNSLYISTSDANNFSPIYFKSERVLSSRGAVSLDVNNDGLLDIVTTSNNDFASVLVNKTDRNSDWIGLKCFPYYLCKNASVRINNEIILDPFKRIMSFASQSLSNVVKNISPKNKNLNLKIFFGEKQIEFSISSLNKYYQLNLKDRVISEIQASKDTTASHYSDVEEYLYLLKKDETPSARQLLLLQSIEAASDETKKLVLSEIEFMNSKNGVALAQAWSVSDNTEIAISAIQILEKLEVENSVPLLISFLESEKSEIFCASAKAFEKFFIEEEAVVERKYWAISTLVSRVEHDNEQISICAIDALSESDSYRGVRALTKAAYLNRELVSSRAVNALGKLRQRKVIPDLKQLLKSSTLPFVRAASLVALVRLKADIKKEDITRLWYQDSEYSNFIIKSVLHLPEQKSVILSLPYDLTRDIYIDITEFKMYSRLTHAELFDFKTNLDESKPINQQEAKLQLSQYVNNIHRKRIKESREKVYIAKGTMDRRLHLLRETAKQHCSNSAKASSKTSFNKILCDFSKDSLSSGQIAFSIRRLLNSGKRVEVMDINSIIGGGEVYNSVINELLTDKLIQMNEKKFILKNFEFSTNNLNAIETVILKLDEREKITYLRLLRDKLPMQEFSLWLELLAKKLPNNDEVMFFLKTVKLLAKEM